MTMLILVNGGACEKETKGSGSQLSPTTADTDCSYDGDTTVTATGAVVMLCLVFFLRVWL